MLIPGSLSGDGEWVEASSLARAIETAMVADALLDLDDEGEEATRQRRRTFIAMAKGIIDHLKAHMDITIDAGALRTTGETNGQLPAADTSFSLVGSQITISAGAIRAASATGLRVPLATRTLSGKVS
ncbi:MAG: hypothetical protein ACREM3_20975 [Candidatus Rokuibacteriota bacterium]